MPQFTSVLSPVWFFSGDLDLDLSFFIDPDLDLDLSFFADFDLDLFLEVERDLLLDFERESFLFDLTGDLLLEWDVVLCNTNQFKGLKHGYSILYL